MIFIIMFANGQCKGGEKMHTVYCVLGRTASGKSSIVKRVAEELNMNILKSYTTRKMRENETEETSDHIFINEADIDSYRNDMCAYTDRVGYCSFATFNQLFQSDFYIINPTGYYELKLKTKDMDIQLKTIYITTPYQTALSRAKKRGDLKSWKENYEAENHEFLSFEKSDLVDYRVLNNTTLDDAVNKLKKIIEKDRERNNVQTTN